MDISILRMGRCHVTCERSTIVAAFDARVGDFKIHNAQVREDHTDGRLFISFPGRKTSGVSLAYGETRDALINAAASAYKELP
ncbi:hypothetical protein [Phyllobacterium sp. SB3]|uniref:hypothetical protein n=1 Tax=Phyllobacterium sp. SB3 TaxID=3156073 RepID=UPI0032AEA3A1